MKCKPRSHFCMWAGFLVLSQIYIVVFSFQLPARLGVHVVINIMRHTVPQKRFIVCADIAPQRTFVIDAAQMACIIVIPAHAVAAIQITIRFARADGLTAQPAAVTGKTHHQISKS